MYFTNIAGRHNKKVLKYLLSIYITYLKTSLLFALIDFVAIGSPEPFVSCILASLVLPKKYEQFTTYHIINKVNCQLHIFQLVSHFQALSSQNVYRIRSFFFSLSCTMCCHIQFLCWSPQSWLDCLG